MPRNVKWFAWIWVLTWLADIPMFFWVQAPLPNMNIEPAKQELLRSAYIKLSIGMIFLLIAITLPIFQQAVWKGKNWARWALLLFYVLPLPALFVDPTVYRTVQLPMMIYVIFWTLLEGFGFYLLFTGDARPWFSAAVSQQ